ncbi:MAG: hemerythrin domain-containing protein [Terriglobia bacterium]
MATPSEWLTRHVRRDHEWLLQRLRSLDRCLDNICYYGEVCSDLRGFGALRHRCEELLETLEQHIPEEEQLFARLKTEDGELRPLLAGLVEEHRSILHALKGNLKTLKALESGELLPEDLSTLQDKVRALIGTLERHIATENQRVLPEFEAA